MADVDVQQHRAERWNRAVVGPLTADFLRISTPRDVQEAADRQAAFALYQQQQHHHQQLALPAGYMAPNIIGRLSITIAQAKLVRNYGLTRMDPYVRIRIGHFVYETQTDPNGGKNPRWNRVIHSQLPSGVHTMYVEVYDECSFKMDELIAWTEIKISDAVLRGETHEDWYPLSGKQGEGVEGMLDMVLSFSNATAMQTYSGYNAAVAPVMLVPNVSGRPMPVFVAPHQPHVAGGVVTTTTTTTVAGQQQQQQQPLTVEQQQQQQQAHAAALAAAAAQQPVRNEAEDLKQIDEMFPNVDPEVIKSVYDAHRGNKDTTINALLQMG